MNKIYRIIVKGSANDGFLDWTGSEWTDSLEKLIQEWQTLSNAGYFCRLQTIERDHV